MKMTVLLVLGWVFAGLVLRTGAATDRYVATNGVDTGEGTSSNQPWATLAYAVDKADSNDTIHVAAGEYTTKRELYVNQNQTILGSGADRTIIQFEPTLGAATNRVFRFGSGNVYALADVTVRHGRVLVIDGGGGIYNRGYLTLTRVIVSSNSAAGMGGGIRSTRGSLTLESCRILDNTTASSGGGLEVYGSAMTASNTFFRGNYANTNGGGFYNNGGTGVVWNSAFVDNYAAGGSQCGGGGIGNNGPLSLVNCTISLNRAQQDGGGIWNNITNMTLWVRHCTIVSNTAVNWGGGLDSNHVDPIVMGHTILAGNVAGLYPDTFGTYTSEGYNLIQNTVGATLNGVITGNVLGQSPLLGPLQDNGGPTWTHALGAGSPAHNAGNAGFAGPPMTDQRGAPRIQNGQIDIGAYERLEPDQDKDDMDGQWELMHGLDPTNASDAAQNPDGDAFTSLQEYTADTDPRKADSFWRLSRITVTGLVAIGYTSSVSRVYDLKSVGDLSTGTWNGVIGRTNIAGNGGWFMITDTNAADRRFYRVDVRVPPP